MDMNDVILQAEQVRHDLNGVPGVIDVVGIEPAIPGQVNDGAVESLTLEVLPDGDQVTLNAAVRRGKWA